MKPHHARSLVDGLGCLPGLSEAGGLVALLFTMHTTFQQLPGNHVVSAFPVNHQLPLKR